jgi:cell division protease FtsH
MAGDASRKSRKPDAAGAAPTPDGSADTDVLAQWDEPAAESVAPTKGAEITLARPSLTKRLRRRLEGVTAYFAEHVLLVSLGFAGILLIVLFFVGLSVIAPGSPGTETPLSNATSLIKAKQVPVAQLFQVDQQLTFTTRSGKSLWSSYPDNATPDLLTTLQQGGTQYTIDNQVNKLRTKAVVQFLLPILILVTLFAFFMTLARESAGGGFAAFSKWTGKGQKAGTGRFTFDDVAGAPEALVELAEICDYLENPGRYARLGAHAPRGVILTGPPGTGKTLLARAVAGEANANFFSISGSEFVESLVGVGAARVRDLFRQAREAAPAIIFIDELDAVGRQRGAGMGQGHDEREQTLNQMLVEMDGFGAETGVVVMAATNRPDILDNALLRPGRFDRQVVVDLPDVHGRTEILALHASKAPVSPSVDFGRIAHQTPGMSGADLANVINEASLLTVRAGKDLIEQIELEEAIDRVLAGPARRSHLLEPEELWRIAVHESGHAIVARAIGNPVSLQKLSIIARGRGRGGATLYSSSDKLLLSHLDLAKNLVTAMSGAAAEDYVFGMLSTGVEGDLETATKMAHAMVSSYGMSPAIGPVAIGEKPGEVFIGRDLANMGNVAAQTLELVDAETRRMVREAEETAKQVIAENETLLDDLANTLLAQETLSGPALEVFLEAVQLWDEPLVQLKADDRRPAVRMRRASGPVDDTDVGGWPAPRE